jgi:hypothetical protein
LRVQALEDINLNCDFPNSLTILVGGNLIEQLRICFKKLESIEQIDKEFLETPLMQRINNLAQENAEI